MSHGVAFRKPIAINKSATAIVLKIDDNFEAVWIGGWLAKVEGLASDLLEYLVSTYPSISSLAWNSLCPSRAPGFNPSQPL